MEIIVRTWQLQEAKAQLSKVVRCAGHEGPQAITVRDNEEAVVLSRADYERLRTPKPSLVSFLRNSPLANIPLDLGRDTSPTRPVDL